MIKINLLESITDKPIGASTVVERNVSSPKSRFIVLAAVVGFLTIVFVAGDYLWATTAQGWAQKDLDTQKQIATQMESIIKEQADLEQKIKSIDDRINAIKDLKAKQGGPSAVLDALSERIAGTPGLYLESLEQKGEQLTIKGNSPNEYAVTQFGRSLEFSSGLFTNLNIETQLKQIEAAQLGNTAGSNAPETLNFTIRCGYSPSKGNQTPANGTQQATNGTPPTAASQAPGAPPVIVVPPPAPPAQVAQK